MPSSTNYRKHRRTLLTPRASSVSAPASLFSRAFSAKKPQSYKSRRRKISASPRSWFFSDGFLLWQTSSGVRRLRLGANAQRCLFVCFCLLGSFFIGFASYLFYQHDLLKAQTRRLADSAALLREAQVSLLSGSDNSTSDFNLSNLSRSQKMLSLLEPSFGSGDGDERGTDIKLLQDRALIERDLRSARKALLNEQHARGDLVLEYDLLKKQNSRLARELRGRGQDLEFHRTALTEVQKRKQGADDRLARIESSALSLLKDLRGILGSEAGVLPDDIDDPMLAIRDLAQTFASETDDRRLKMAEYSEYLDYAIVGLERTIFALGIQPNFLEGGDYGTSSFSSYSDSDSTGSSLLSLGSGGPLGEDDSQDGSPRGNYIQSFSALDSKFKRFNALRNLIVCMPLGHPLHGDGRFVSGYGRRIDPFTKEPAIHYGIDFGAWYDSDVYAGGKGRVTYTGYKSSYGRVIEVSHGCGFQTRYAHLSSINVKVGDEVDNSSVLGRVGNTGRSTGPHLHYEVRLRNSPFDPKPFIDGVKNVF